MIAALEMTLPLSERDWRRLSLAIMMGFACAVPIARTLPVVIDAISTIPAPLCADNASGSSLNNVEVIASHALPNVPGKRVTVVRVTYGPGGFTPPHRHGGSVTATPPSSEICSRCSCVRDAEADASCWSFSRLPNRSEQRQRNAHNVCCALDQEIEGSQVKGNPVADRRIGGRVKERRPPTPLGRRLHHFESLIFDRSFN
jgi:hypothetical protein